MKSKRFQWLSNLRKFVRNSLCWWIRKKNGKKQEIEDIEIMSLPDGSLFSPRISMRLSHQESIQQSPDSALEFRQPACKDIFNLEDYSSLLILLTERNVKQLPCPKIKRETFPVISLPWVQKLSDIWHGHKIEIKAELPMIKRYEDLQRSWITTKIFECAWGSYPSISTKMQIVPFERQRPFFYLEFLSGESSFQDALLTTARPATKRVTTTNGPEGDMGTKDSGIHTYDEKGEEMIADILPLNTITSQSDSDHLRSKLPSIDTLVLCMMFI